MAGASCVIKLSSLSIILRALASICRTVHQHDFSSQVCSGKSFLIRTFNNAIKNFQIGLFSTTFIINWESFQCSNYPTFQLKDITRLKYQDFETQTVKGVSLKDQTNIQPNCILCAIKMNPSHLCILLFLRWKDACILISRTLDY